VGQVGRQGPLDPEAGVSVIASKPQLQSHIAPATEDYFSASPGEAWLGWVARLRTAAIPPPKNFVVFVM
jgi:hypothetical protein